MMAQDVRTMLWAHAAEGVPDASAPASLEDTATFFVERGAEIDTAQQGDDAVERAHEARGEGNPYSLAIVDMGPPPGLAGLETEYAMRYRPDDPDGRIPSKFNLYQALIRALGARVLSVQSRHFKEGRFMAYGGAVWVEAERPAAGQPVMMATLVALSILTVVCGIVAQPLEVWARKSFDILAGM